MDPLGVFYVSVKFAAYAGWCALGLFIFRRAASLWSSLKLGLLRLGIGVVFGLSIFLIGGMMHLDPPAWPFVTYLALYTPVRIVEWLILYVILSRAALDSARPAARFRISWILGGVVVSFLADIPMLLRYEGAGQFLPVGRFLC